MRSSRERLAWFVESDVAVHANPEQQQIQTAGGSDGFFVAFAFNIEVGRVSVQTIGSIGVEIDSREEMLGQEPSKAASLRRVEADEFIQEERGRRREVGLPCRMKTAYFRVGLNWRSTRRKAKDEIGSTTKGVSHASSERSTGFRCRLEDGDVQGLRRMTAGRGFLVP